jgi:cold shock CspA family protein
MPQEKRIKGVVKPLMPGKMYGFIKVDGEPKEYFFHKDDFDGFWEDLQADLLDRNAKIEVDFEIKQSEKGPRAANVKRLDWPN